MGKVRGETAKVFPELSPSSGQRALDAGCERRQALEGVRR